MKPFQCDICNKNVKIQDAIVRWHCEKEKKIVNNLQIVHNSFPCNQKGEDNFFNRDLPLEFVYKNMPEFISYINRFDIDKEEFKKFVNRIEKDRTYIRRFNVNKRKIKNMIIRLDGLGSL